MAVFTAHLIINIFKLKSNTYYGKNSYYVHILHEMFAIFLLYNKQEVEKKLLLNN